MPGGRPRTSTSASEPSAVKTVAKVLDILEHLGAARGPSIVSDVARATGFNVSTAFRLLQTLAARGYVEQQSGGRGYTLGPRIFQLGSSYLEGNNLASMVRPHIEALRDQLKETVYLTIFRQGENIQLCKADGQQVVSATVKSAAREPAYCTASGKVLLSGLAEDELARYMATVRFQAQTPQTITSKPQLLREVETVRGQGYALDLEEFAKDLCCASVPVHHPADGTVLAAISVAMPKARFKKSALPGWIARLQETSAVISQHLGLAPG
jgi:IclR family transcriptional regulator, KDG regulon repressor